MEKGYVRTGHLVYIIIIAIIILSFFLVIAFGGTDNASTTMGTASTVSSLILSVIAIVLSLIDVSGQKQSIVDLKETAENLTKASEQSQLLVQDLLVNLNEIALIRSQLDEQFKANNEWLIEMKSLLSDEKSEKEPQEIVEKLKSGIQKHEILNPLGLVNPLGLAGLAGTKIHITADQYNKAITGAVKNLLNNEYKPGETEILHVLINKIQQKIPLTSSMCDQAINNLNESGFLMKYKNENGICVKFINF